MSRPGRRVRERSGRLLAGWLAAALPALGAAAPPCDHGAWIAAKLAREAPAVANAELGFAVASDGDWTALGARFGGTEGNGTEDAGAVYLSSSEEGVLEKVLVNGKRHGDQFGISVALNSDTLAVGAVGEERDQERPTVKVYLQPDDPSTEEWVEQQPSVIGPPGVRRFGRAVALGGEWLAISATVPLADGEQGVVRLYPLMPGQGVVRDSPGDELSRAGTDPQPGDRFGESLAFAGGLLIVGAPGHRGRGGQPAAGAAYVFAPASGLSRVAELHAADERADAQFGSAVAASGTTIVVGAPGAVGAVGEAGSSGAAGSAAVSAGRNGSGAVYVFALDHGNTRIATATRRPETWTQQAKLAPASAAAGVRLGHSVAIDGDLLIAGAPLDAACAPAAGAAYLFQRTGSAWTELNKVVAAGAPAHALFGFAVAQSGNSFVVGAPLAEDRAGAAYVFGLCVTPGGLELCSAGSRPRASKSGSWRRPAPLAGCGAVLP